MKTLLVRWVWNGSLVVSMLGSGIAMAADNRTGQSSSTTPTAGGGAASLNDTKPTITGPVSVGLPPPKNFNPLTPEKPPTPPAANTDPHDTSVKGEISAVHGTVTMISPDGVVTALEPGMEVPVGAEIRTAAGSTVDIFLGRNAGVVRLAENTTLLVPTLKTSDTGSETVSQLQLELKNGTLMGFVNKLNEASTYEVKLPDGTVDVRRGTFQIVSGETSGRTTGNPSSPSIVRLLNGQGTFTHGGEMVALGGGVQEYNGSSQTSGPLSPALATVLGQAFLGVDFAPQVPGSTFTSQTTPDPSSAGGPAPRLLPPSVPPQQLPLSPTTGH